MATRPQSPAEMEWQIREWFARHRHDYCRCCQEAPPLVWSTHFQWLLDHLPVREEDGTVRLRTDTA